MHVFLIVICYLLVHAKLSVNSPLKMSTRSKKIPALSSDNEAFREEMKILIKEEIISAFAIYAKKLCKMSI